MELQTLTDTIKAHPNFHLAGMILAHTGVVRGTSRDGRYVSGLKVQVDHQKLDTIIKTAKHCPGIVDVQVWINEDKDLLVGDTVMHLVVAGDIREHVISALETALNTIKTTVTRKTEVFT